VLEEGPAEAELNLLLQAVETSAGDGRPHLRQRRAPQRAAEHELDRQTTRVTQIELNRTCGQRGGRLDVVPICTGGDGQLRNGGRRCAARRRAAGGQHGADQQPDPEKTQGPGSSATPSATVIVPSIPVRAVARRSIPGAYDGEASGVNSFSLPRKSGCRVGGRHGALPRTGDLRSGSEKSSRRTAQRLHRLPTAPSPEHLLIARRRAGNRTRPRIAVVNAAIRVARVDGWGERIRTSNPGLNSVAPSVGGRA
jgi:hypothetical protein